MNSPFCLNIGDLLTTGLKGTKPRGGNDDEVLLMVFVDFADVLFSCMSNFDMFGSKIFTLTGIDLSLSCMSNFDMFGSKISTSKEKNIYNEKLYHSVCLNLKEVLLMVCIDINDKL